MKVVFGPPLHKEKFSMKWEARQEIVVFVLIDPIAHMTTIVGQHLRYNHLR